MNFVTMQLNNNQIIFFELVKAGLWEKEVWLSQFENIDYEEVYRLAVEQSVVGLVAAGIEHVTDVKIPQNVALSFVGDTLQLEQQNKAMNGFVAQLIEKLRKEDVYTILVKGQGIAQCYERPLWRASGDVDLLLSDINYEKAKNVLLPLAIDVEQEYESFKHIGMTMKGGYVVELHGTMHSRLSKRVDRGNDEAQKDVFYGGKVRSVEFKGSNGSRLASPTVDATRQSSSVLGSALTASTVQVFLPALDEDVVFVFTHILHHFYIEGIGLRQICDWCRLLWTYKDSLNRGLLESRIRKMGLMTEWKAFAALAVDRLGMPVEAMPMYSSDRKWSKKAEKIIEFVLETGNFGHNRRAASGKVDSAWNKMKDFARHTRVFPLDSIKFFFHFVGSGVQVATETVLSPRNSR